jgi:hypothetical protein
MKNRFPISTLQFLLCVLCASAVNLGCAAIDKDADPVVVTSERTIQAAFESVDALVQFDAANRQLVQATAPQLHAFAESVRKTAPAQFDAAWAALHAYQANKSPATGQTLNDAAAVVENLARQARLYLAQVNPPPK